MYTLIHSLGRGCWQTQRHDVFHKSNDQCYWKPIRRTFQTKLLQLVNLILLEFGSVSSKVNLRDF